MVAEFINRMWNQHWRCPTNICLLKHFLVQPPGSTVSPLANIPPPPGKQIRYVDFSSAILQDMQFRGKCINVHHPCAPVDYLKKMLTTFSSVVPCMTTTDPIACKLLTL